MLLFYERAGVAISASGSTPLIGATISGEGACGEFCEVTIGLLVSQN
jgi:hypothetical protein